MTLFDEGCLERLNFSDEWRNLYQKAPWPPETPNKKCIYSKGSNNYLRDQNSWKNNPLLANLIFNPYTHSTPNKKEVTLRNNSMNPDSDISVEAMSFSTTYPHNTSANDSNSLKSNLSDTNKSPVIQTISQSIDDESRIKFTSREFIPECSEAKVKSIGIRGTHRVMSLALTDDSLKKNTHLQAYSLTVIILALILISAALVYISSHRHIEIAKVNVPIKNIYTKAVEHVKQESDSIKNATLSERRIDLNDQIMADEGITTKNVTNTVDTLRLKLFDTTMKPKLDNEVRVTTYSKMNRFCAKCNLSEEVCMLNESTGTPYCEKAIDLDDPTGCGGLCSLETEACVAVDHQRQVKVCRVLNVLKCSPLQWRCHDGHCVNKSGRCDGKVDCFDRSDEIQCECDLKKNFHCGQFTSCLSKTKLCDGVVDCWDGTDEANCTSGCRKNHFVCMSGECVARTRFCDGFPDCSDKSDEPQGCDGPCGAQELRCRNGRCVPIIARCDKRDQCGDNSDEIGCT